MFEPEKVRNALFSRYNCVTVRVIAFLRSADESACYEAAIQEPSLQCLAPTVHIVTV